MATYVLIHGSGDSSWYWHLLAAELRERGHYVVGSDAVRTRKNAGPQREDPGGPAARRRPAPVEATFGERWT